VIKVLVTGASGFIGKNLITHLDEHDHFTALAFLRQNSIDELQAMVDQADAIIHLAGENRPKDVSAFEKVNVRLTQLLCDSIITTGRKIPLVLASSIQAEHDNPYGKSKLRAEQAVEKLAKQTNNPVYIYRLSNVFGKWCKPDYNSVVATFCHNIAHNLPIQINDTSTSLKLVYVDDVVSAFLRVIQQTSLGVSRLSIEPEYSTSLGEMAKQIKAFKNCRSTLLSEIVGKGLVRALYSTYMSYLNPEQFSYSLPQYGDERGIFVEMLKTKDSGQFSYFTSHPGISRGGHYHHSKSEKFLVIMGKARFRFRNIITNESYELFTSSEQPKVVDTVPGWSHDIKNIGTEEMVVMLWANEIFDRDNPDTIEKKV
jgi:UDP-2-acetamido-2,6-beta-L-arabino-hexul-4-ose reductase